MRKEKGGRVRITGGELGGRVIDTPKGDTHPMGERERLALFNMLGESVESTKVLDAYAGSGALGIEALSRGALKVVFVEKNAGACRAIRENLRKLGVSASRVGVEETKVEEKAEIVQGDVSNYMTDDKFDVILADPPYDKFETEGIVHLVQFLRKDGVLILSHPEEAPELVGMVLEKSRKYAGARISVYHKD